MSITLIVTEMLTGGLFNLIYLNPNKHIIQSINKSINQFVYFPKYWKKNQKIEIRLTRRAEAYTSSCSQTVSLSPAISYISCTEKLCLHLF